MSDHTYKHASMGAWFETSVVSIGLEPSGFGAATKVRFR
jgi:hypothetical protein